LRRRELVEEWIKAQRCIVITTPDVRFEGSVQCLRGQCHTP
jgi:hypothetical protein